MYTLNEPVMFQANMSYKTVANVAPLPSVWFNSFSNKFIHHLCFKAVFSTVLSMSLQLNTVFRGAECHVSQEMSGGMQQLVWELGLNSNFSFWLRELVCRDRR